jgi:hypothetical protein
MVRSEAKGAKTSWSAPRSALELRPRIALSSAKVSNSVAGYHRRTAIELVELEKRRLLFGNIFWRQHGWKKYLTSVTHPRALALSSPGLQGMLPFASIRD